MLGAQQYGFLFLAIPGNLQERQHPTLRASLRSSYGVFRISLVDMHVGRLGSWLTMCCGMAGAEPRVRPSSGHPLGFYCLCSVILGVSPKTRAGGFSETEGSLGRPPQGLCPWLSTGLGASCCRALFLSGHGSCGYQETRFCKNQNRKLA